MDNECIACGNYLEDCDCDDAETNVRRMFEKFGENEYLESDRIPDSDKPTNRNDLNAFIKLDKLVPGNKDIVGCAEHDEIFLSIELSDLAHITEDDILYLVRCGVRVGEHGLCMFA